MSESSVNVTEGAGKRLHTNQRTINAVAVEDEYMLMGEPFLVHGVMRSGVAVSMATAADHLMQIMATASLNLYIRRIRIYQAALATAAQMGTWQLLRLTTAGTGGTAITPQAYDSTDTISATAMTLPTVKGTEGSLFGSHTAVVIQTAPTGGATGLLAEWDFDRLRGKSIRIPAGTTNGLVIKNLTALAASSCWPEIEYTEANF